MSNTDKKENFFRFGIIAKGIVYTLIGGLTFAGAVNLIGGQTTDQFAVIKFLQEQPFGRVILVLLGVGLLGYCAWRLYTVLEEDSSEKKTLAKHLGYIGSGLFYGGLGLFSLVLAIKGGASSDGGSSTILGDLLQKSWGQIAIGIGGVAFIGTGIYQFYKGWSEEFLDDLKSNAKSKMDNYSAYKTLGKVGYIARSPVYFIMAYFMLNAALTSDADKIKGMSGVFEYLKELSFGGVLVILLALGLLAHGLFMFVKAKYHSFAKI